MKIFFPNVLGIDHLALAQSLLNQFGFAGSFKSILVTFSSHILYFCVTPDEPNTLNSHCHCVPGAYNDHLCVWRKTEPERDLAWTIFICHAFLRGDFTALKAAGGSMKALSHASKCNWIKSRCSNFPQSWSTGANVRAEGRRRSRLCFQVAMISPVVWSPSNDIDRKHKLHVCFYFVFCFSRGGNYSLM